MENFYAAIVMSMFVSIIACRIYKRILSNRFLKLLSNAYRDGTKVRLFDGRLILDFNDGVIRNRKGKQIKCIYR